MIDTGSGYDSQSDVPVHFGLPGGQIVDVEITILAGGERRVEVIQGVDPRDYAGAALIVRIDDDGVIAR